MHQKCHALKMTLHVLVAVLILPLAVYRSLDCKHVMCLTNAWYEAKHKTQNTMFFRSFKGFRGFMFLPYRVIYNIYITSVEHIHNHTFIFFRRKSNRRGDKFHRQISGMKLVCSV